MPWSYSSLKKFNICPRQYYHVKVIQDVKDPPHETALYGNEIHKVLEEHILDAKPVPEKHKQFEEFAKRIRDMAGAKFPEYKMGVKKARGNTVTDCDFDDEEAWWRGIADLIILRKDKEQAKLFDYKTGNPKYADPTQLDQLAVGVFAHFPEANHIQAGLLFIVKGEVVKREYKREEFDGLLKKMRKDVQLLEKAHDTEVWSPKVGWACKRCPVKSCEFNEKEGE